MASTTSPGDAKIVSLPDVPVFVAVRPLQVPGDGVGVIVGAGLGVALGRDVGVGVGVGVGVTGGVGAISQFVGLIVGQGVLDGDGVGVGVGVGVTVTSGGVGVGVGDGAGMFVPSGEWMLPPLGTQSVGSSRVPMTLPTRNEASPMIVDGITTVRDVAPKMTVTMPPLP